MPELSLTWPAADRDGDTPVERTASAVSGALAAHGDLVYRALRRFGMSESDLEDACQEVFVVLHRRLSQGECHAVRAFLYGTARRVAAKHRRQRTRRAEVSWDELEPVLATGERMPDAHRRAEQREALSALQAALARLSVARREVFVLYEVEQLEAAEIAELVGCPLNTVYSRLRLARSEVKAHLRRALRREGER